MESFSDILCMITGITFRMVYTFVKNRAWLPETVAFSSWDRLLNRRIVAPCSVYEREFFTFIPPVAAESVENDGFAEG